MTTRTRTFWTAMLAAAMAVMMVLPAAADHIGNNKAALAGADGVTGQSIANYSKGSDTVQAHARVNGLAPPATTRSSCGTTTGAPSRCAPSP